MTSLRNFLLLAFASFAFTGCGSKYHSVTGEIVFPDGTAAKGLAGGQIVFQKVAAATGDGATTETNSASSPIDDNGRFTLGTDEVADGAPAGEYQVLISPPQASGDEQLPPVIDAKYSRPGGLTEIFTVKPGSNYFKVTVEPAK